MTPQVLRRQSPGADPIFTRHPPCWAAIEPLTVDGRRGVGIEGESADYRITMRARDDLRIGDRLLEGKRIFVIAALPEPLPDCRRLICLCRELVAP